MTGPPGRRERRWQHARREGFDGPAMGSPLSRTLSGVFVGPTSALIEGVRNAPLCMHISQGGQLCYTVVCVMVPTFGRLSLASENGACPSMNLFDPQGPIAAAEKTILIDSIAIMLAIVLPTIATIFAFAFWFRQSNPRAEYRPEWAHSGRIELVVWSIPALTVILLGGVAWIGSHQLDPAAPVAGTGNPVRIQVVSLDWKWLFIYPDQRIATVNALTVPAGAPLQFELTSASVMNAFFIPQFGSMIYTMNGMVTHLQLRADKEGIYQGISSHFSGDGFPDMMFDVH